MDDVPSDGMLATLRRSRRAALFALAAAGIGLAGAPTLDARKKHRRKQKRRQKVKKNTFGCVNFGKYCKRDSQCCSGICSGKKGKKTCRGHDASTCQSGQDICFDESVKCTTTSGLPGVCTITTGHASFCTTFGVCAECTRDADCVPHLGPGAACVVCVADCGDTTARGTLCAIPVAPVP